jgi:hypothetical protein
MKQTFETEFIFYVRNIGTVRAQSMQRPPVIKKIVPLTTATPIHKTETTPLPIMPSLTTGKLLLELWNNPVPGASNLLLRNNILRL